MVIVPFPIYETCSDTFFCQNKVVISRNEMCLWQTLLLAWMLWVTRTMIKVRVTRSRILRSPNSTCWSKQNQIQWPKKVCMAHVRSNLQYFLSFGQLDGQIDNWNHNSILGDQDPAMMLKQQALDSKMMCHWTEFN